MFLYLSSPSALNSIYFTESGHAVYKVDTPYTCLGGSKRTTIRRAVETVDGLWLGDEEKTYNDEIPNQALVSLFQLRSTSPSPTLSSGSSTDRQFEGHFAHLAQIEYNALKSSRIMHDGKEMHTSRLFKAQGWSWYGFGSHKVFRASDGCEYRWVINSRNPKLVSNDSSKTIVARFHRPQLEFSLTQTACPSLEIHAEGRHIMDEIFITFVYLRHAEER